MKKLTLILASLALVSLPARSAEVRLNGASTTVQAVITPHKTAVESATGLKLTVLGTNTGVGLKALLAGQCDASLTSEPLDVSMLAGKFAGLDLNPADFQLHTVRHDYVVFVANKDNPVGNLTMAQIHDLLSGKIANWKEIGGVDAPVVVFTDLVGAGTRTLVQTKALGGADYAPRTRPLENIRLVVSAVGELKGGFAAIGTSFVDPKFVKIVSAEKISRDLGFITKGEPSSDVRKVIEAYKTIAK